MHTWCRRAHFRSEFPLVLFEAGTGTEMEKMSREHAHCVCLHVRHCDFAVCKSQNIQEKDD